MIQFYSENKKLLMQLVLLLLVGVVVSKELVLLNEEFLLILAFLTFLYLSVDIFSQLFADELDSRAKNIGSTFQEFLFYKQKVVIALREFYARIGRIEVALTQIEGNVLRALKKIESLFFINRNVENYLVEQHMRTLFYEQFKFFKHVYIHALKEFSLSINALGDSDEFTNNQINSLLENTY